VAVVAGAWLAVGAACLSAVAALAMRLWLRVRRPAPLAQSALAAVVAHLSPTFTRYLKQLGKGRVDTVALLRAGILDDPSRWPVAVGSLPEVNGSEGGVVAGTVWTVVAAEAALVAGQHPDRATPVDATLLAAISVLLPHSHAQVALKAVPDAARRAWEATGLSMGQLNQMLIGAAKRPGGELLMARVEMDVRAGSPKGAVLAEQEWQRLGAPGNPVGRRHG
jgi:hypothetical protein